MLLEISWDTYTETEKQQEKWKLNVVAVVSMAMISNLVADVVMTCGFIW